MLKGLQGQAIDRERYDNVMPAPNFFTDEQIANVLTHVRNNFDNKAFGVMASEVKAVRAKTYPGSRYPAFTFSVPHTRRRVE